MKNTIIRIMLVLIFTLLILFVCGLNVEANVREWDISKDSSSSVKATLNYDNKTLEISGYGDMQDWSIGNYPPWYGNTYDIEKVIIGNELKNIGKNETNCEEEICLYGGKAQNNYLQYPTSSNVNENIWRITGTYNIDETRIVKLIGSLNSTTTLSNIQESLNTIYNSLEKKEDYIYNTNKFNCTTSGCTDSNYNNIGLLTTYEYNLVGRLNSYLANQNNFAWLR